METFRSKDLLSSRGIFETALKLAAAELGLRGNFNAAETIKRIQSNGRGRWRNVLVDATKKCFPGQAVRDTLDQNYRTLSEDIHGQPWTINAVQLSDQLTREQNCFIRELCKAFKMSKR